MDTEYIYSKAKRLSQKIDVLELSQHAYDKLYWNGYRTLGKLSKLTVQDILAIDGIGKVYCAEIVEKAASVGVIIQDNSIISKTKHHKEIIKLPYPHNLLAEVFGDTTIGQVNKSLTADLIEGISYSLHRIDERAATIILLRYKHYASCNEIGNYFEISTSRVQQIIDKTIQQLRHPSFRLLITKGLHSYIQDKISTQVEAQVEARLRGEYLRGYTDGINEAKKDSQENGRQSSPSPNLSLSIEDMDLSIRSFNCLKRAGIHYLGDLLNYQNTEDIWKIRNMGRRCLIEIATKVQSYGFVGTVWDEFLKQATLD